MSLFNLRWQNAEQIEAQCCPWVNFHCQMYSWICMIKYKARYKNQTKVFLLWVNRKWLTIKYFLPNKDISSYLCRQMFHLFQMILFLFCFWTAFFQYIKWHKLSEASICFLHWLYYFLDSSSFYSRSENRDIPFPYKQKIILIHSY